MTRRATQLVLAAALAAACASASPAGPVSFPKDPLTTVTSSGGKLKVAVWTAPDQPPSRGVLTVKLLATDASTGLTVDDLKLDIVPEMPSMGHGTPVVPKVAASGGGVYLASDVDLFMAGRWDLRVSISGAVADLAVVSIDAR